MIEVERNRKGPLVAGWVYKKSLGSYSSRYLAIYEEHIAWFKDSLDRTPSVAVPLSYIQVRLSHASRSTLSFIISCEQKEYKFKCGTVSQREQWMKAILDHQGRLSGRSVSSPPLSRKTVESSPTSSSTVRTSSGPPSLPQLPSTDPSSVSAPAKPQKHSTTTTATAAVHTPNVYYPPALPQTITIPPGYTAFLVPCSQAPTFAALIRGSPGQVLQYVVPSTSVAVSGPQQTLPNVTVMPPPDAARPPTVQLQLQGQQLQQTVQQQQIQQNIQQQLQQQQQQLQTQQKQMQQQIEQQQILIQQQQQQLQQQQQKLQHHHQQAITTTQQPLPTSPMPFTAFADFDRFDFSKVEPAITTIGPTTTPTTNPSQPQSTDILLVDTTIPQQTEQPVILGSL